MVLAQWHGSRSRKLRDHISNPIVKKGVHTGRLIGYMLLKPVPPPPGHTSSSEALPPKPNWWPSKYSDALDYGDFSHSDHSKFLTPLLIFLCMLGDLWSITWIPHCSFLLCALRESGVRSNGWFQKNNHVWLCLDLLFFEHNEKLFIIENVKHTPK